ncbi:olfactory receptor 2A12-like [Choloepus didactylus]|uniref:olfactory receptor 2A12-like n=1 Tax=Choloepus didactylus TaxID=27675 RepID=UPI0018A00CEC|nr:olfactory receptor 2A12-like [Choloepus didactylus]
MKQENSSTITELILMGFSNLPQAEIPLFFLFSLAYLVNLFGNTAVISLVVLDFFLQTPMYYFLCHLAFINMFFSTLVVPKMLLNFLSTRKVISYNFCLAQTYVTSFLEATECFMLAVMAVDRYVAICYPLRYLLIMNSSVCLALALGTWTISIFATVVPLYFIIVPLCGPYIIDYIFCEFPVILHMFCGDTSLQETVKMVVGAGIVLFPFILIIFSYIHILVAVMRIDSKEGIRKSFSTCTPHLIVVTIYYGTGLVRFMRHKSLYSAEGDKIISLFYAVIIPMMNPFIYSLRNKEVKGAMQRVMVRYQKDNKSHSRIFKD